MKNKNIIIGIAISALILAIFSINLKYINRERADFTRDKITIQKMIEEDFNLEGFSLDEPNVILNPYNNSPLTALIIFETKEEISVHVQVKGKDELTTINWASPSSKQHYLPIYGLYAGQENSVVLKAGNKTNTVIIETENLPEDFALPTEVISEKSKLTNDFYFFTPASKGYTSAYDVNGDVRWFLTDKMSWDISKLNNGRLLLSTDRSISPPYFTTGLYEIDFLGKIYNEFSLPGGYHHDFFEMENGNLLVATDDFDNEHGTVEDVIVELNRETGKIVKTWDLKDILDMEQGKSENWTTYDWFHNNSVWYDKSTDSITLSGRHQDAVINIDYNTGNLKWIIGDDRGWSLPFKKYFFTPVEGQEDFEWQWSQHAAMITPEGNVFILDNGNNKSKLKDKYVRADESYTRGVMYDIDTENMTIKQVWQYGKERGHEFYSPYVSDVDYIKENHYIVHSGGIVYADGLIANQPAGFFDNPDLYSTTVELLNDEVIFEITLPNNMYRSEKMNIYENTSFEFGSASKLGTLGKTKKTKSYLGIPSKAIMSDEEYEKYKIKITEEQDRLVLNGHFDKEKETSLLLYKNLTIKEYSIRVSRKPYTALCLDLFTTDEDDKTIEVNKYINKEGLSGEYSIYLKIGDKIYNTGKKVDFSLTEFTEEYNG